jgi:hypothetical protein
VIPNPAEEKLFLFGGAAPKPLGFTAFGPGLLLALESGTGSLSSNPGIRDGARVASLRCPILRSGEVSLNLLPSAGKNLFEKLLAGAGSGKVQLSRSGCGPVGRF